MDGFFSFSSTRSSEFLFPDKEKEIESLEKTIKICENHFGQVDTPYVMDYYK